MRQPKMPTEASTVMYPSDSAVTVQSVLLYPEVSRVALPPVTRHNTGELAFCATSVI